LWFWFETSAIRDRDACCHAALRHPARAIVTRDASGSRLIDSMSHDGEQGENEQRRHRAV
jgi:hypothetical protein